MSLTTAAMAPTTWSEGQGHIDTVFSKMDTIDDLTMKRIVSRTSMFYGWAEGPVKGANRLPVHGNDAAA
jgi:hypothetical protein